MSSKFIPKSKISNTHNNYTWSNQNVEWSSVGVKEDKSIKEEKNFMKSEKERIEKIPLEELTFRDIYKFPFHRAKYGTWVYDVDSNFIFQFENYYDDKGNYVENLKEQQEKCLQILNGEIEEYNRHKVESKNGEIYINDVHFITIRNWGRLTGVGAYNLDSEYACKIQDTLEKFIVEKFKK